MRPRGNPKPNDNPPNKVLNVPVDSDPIVLDSSSSYSSDSSNDEYHKRRRHAKNNKNKLWSKTRFNKPIRKCTKITSKLLTAEYKSELVKLKLDEDPLQNRVYFLSFMNSIKIVLSQFSEK